MRLAKPGLSVPSPRQGSARERAFGQIYICGDALCLHNLATGRERTIPPVVEPGPGPRHKIVVVGAGPVTPDRMSAQSTVHWSSGVCG